MIDGERLYIGDPRTRMILIDYCDRNPRGVLELRHDLADHSAQFAWGYLGSGPAQTAVAILAHATGDDAFARDRHQEFKHDVISTIAGDGVLLLSAIGVRAWAQKRRELEPEPMTGR